ncbi:MAG: ugpQ [Gammaproteobacteria bacterium]|jgi:glycerophosphoryl diester phosphodiesterase|nr:ugpQ [Gammaproteobacteria bacterium]
MTIFQTKPKLIAHRGANLLAPENTLPAFALAYEMGAAWVECDVVLTADHVPVILHDRDLWRTARLHADIDKLNYADLRNYNVGRYFSKDYAHTSVPKLEELLELAVRYGRGVNIEIKPALPEYAKETAEYSYKVIEPYLKHIPILISSFELDALKWYRQYAPEVDLGFLLSRWLSEWERVAVFLNAVSIHCNEKILTQKRLSLLKQSKYSVLAYTVNSVARAEELFSSGVDGIFSDDPLLLSRVAS